MALPCSCVGTFSQRNRNILFTDLRWVFMSLHQLGTGFVFVCFANAKTDLFVCTTVRARIIHKKESSLLSNEEDPDS